MDTIKKRATFLKITRHGVRSRTNNIVLLCLSDTSIRGVEVGYTASKKVGNAVSRNLAKRRMRSVIFNLQNMLKNSCRYVLIANTSTTTCDFANLTNDIKWCIKNVHHKCQKHTSSISQ